MIWEMQAKKDIQSSKWWTKLKERKSRQTNENKERKKKLLKVVVSSDLILQLHHPQHIPDGASLAIRFFRWPTQKNK